VVMVVVVAVVAAAECSNVTRNSHTKLVSISAIQFTTSGQSMAKHGMV